MPESHLPGYDHRTESFLIGEARQAAVTSNSDKDDKALFRASVKGARQLRQQQVVTHRKRLAPIPRKPPEDAIPVRDELPASDMSRDEIEAGDELMFARPGLQHGVMRKLRRGQFSVGAELDLHGMTAHVAHRALNGFLTRCLAADARCVRIIHGKGLSTPNRQPVLKARVNTWLQQSNDVLAFCSAPARDGGTGAVYVLLRKQR